LIVGISFERGVAIFFEYSLFMKERSPWEETGGVEELWKFRSSWIGLSVRLPILSGNILGGRKKKRKAVPF
jgi:hypothetical protein